MRDIFVKSFFRFCIVIAVCAVAWAAGYYIGRDEAKYVLWIAGVIFILTWWTA